LAFPAQGFSKPIQGKPRQRSLVFLGFIRPIRGFSTGYGESKLKNSRFPFALGSGARVTPLGSAKRHASTNSDFRKEIV
jgi:hypothetical protein